MAENTIQARWIIRIVTNLNLIFANEPNVFIASDLLWYPVKDEPKINLAPDVLGVFGRPKGDRPCWVQHLEDGIPPQVVFEIVSPSNDWKEMVDKLHFYDAHGVEEYYTYDPERKALTVYVRRGELLRRVLPLQDWVSPRLKIRFHWSHDGEELELFLPDGRPFQTLEELDARNTKLTAKLRELGIDPDTI